MFARNRFTLSLLLAITMSQSLSTAILAAPLAPTLQAVKQCISAGQHAKALSQVDQFLKNEPDSAMAHYYRGQVLAKTGNREKAKQEFETAALLDPTPAFASDCQKQIDNLVGTPGKNKVFQLKSEQNRTINDITPGLRKQLRSQVSDLYAVASGSAPIKGFAEDEPLVSLGPKRGPRQNDQKSSIADQQFVIPQVTLTAKEKQNLSRHDVYFIIDHSGSMSNRDCPGRHSRWNWIQAEMNQMEAETKGCMPRGVTMVFFDSNADEYKQVTSQEMLRLINEFGPRGSTNTGLAVRSQMVNISRSLAANHPVIVIAITDGLPNNKLELTRALTDLDYAASRQKQSLKISFLQIGSDANGLQTLNDLNDLLSAHKTLVNVRAFDEVSKKGLTRTILDEL